MMMESEMGDVPTVEAEVVRTPLKPPAHLLESIRLWANANHVPSTTRNIYVSYLAEMLAIRVEDMPMTPNLKEGTPVCDMTSGDYAKTKIRPGIKLCSEMKTVAAVRDTLRRMLNSVNTFEKYAGKVQTPIEKAYFRILKEFIQGKLRSLPPCK